MVVLNHRIRIDAPIERCFNLARSVEVHLLRNQHFGAPARAIGGVTSGMVGMGQQVTWRARHFYVWQNLTSEITAFEQPSHFQETMLTGAFRFMQHDHYFRSLAGGTLMESHFCFAAPLPVLGLIAERLVLRRYMQALLAERNLVIKQVAESADWPCYLSEETEK